MLSGSSQVFAGSRSLTNSEQDSECRSAQGHDRSSSQSLALMSLSGLQRDQTIGGRRLHETCRSSRDTRLALHTRT